MAKTISPMQLAERIQQLVNERQKHADAIALIDETLSGVAASLTGAAPISSRAASAANPAAPATKRKRGGRLRKFATSAEESVLAFIRQNRNPTTQEIKKHYYSEGRGGTADNVLSKLFREKKVRREPLKDQRGSRYLLT